MRAFGTVSEHKKQPVTKASYFVQYIEDLSAQSLVKLPKAQINRIYGKNQLQPRPQPQQEIIHIIQKAPYYFQQQKIHVLERQRPMTFTRPVPSLPPIIQNNISSPPLNTNILQSSVVEQFQPTQVQNIHQTQPPPQHQPEFQQIPPSNTRQQVILDQDNQMQQINHIGQRYVRLYNPGPQHTQNQIIQNTNLSGPENQLQQSEIVPQHIKLGATPPLIIPPRQVIYQPPPIHNTFIDNNMIKPIVKEQKDNASESSRKSFINFNPIQPLYLQSRSKNNFIDNKPIPAVIPPPQPIINTNTNINDSIVKQKDSESQISVVQFTPIEPIKIQPIPFLRSKESSSDISVVDFQPLSSIIIPSRNFKPTY